MGNENIKMATVWLWKISETTVKLLDFIIMVNGNSQESLERRYG